MNWSRDSPISRRKKRGSVLLAYFCLEVKENKRWEKMKVAFLKQKKSNFYMWMLKHVYQAAEDSHIIHLTKEQDIEITNVSTFS